MKKREHIPCAYAEFVIDDIFCFLKQFKYHFEQKSFLYRGQADASWWLKTSYERYKEEKLTTAFDPRYFDGRCDRFLFHGELAAISHYRAANKICYDAKRPKLEALSEMQHYGAPTRLLDVTESFGVALFFAVVENPNHGDAAIWVINKNLLITSFIGNHEPKSQVTKTYLMFNPRVETTLPFDDEFAIDNFSQVESRSNDLFCDFAEELIGHQTVTYPPKHIPYSTVYPGVFPIRPSVFNDRILAQRGSFLFQQSLEHSFMNNLLSVFNISQKDFDEIASCDNHPKISDVNADSLAVTTCFMKFIIPHSIFNDCEQVLSSMNINHESLFPDKFGIAKTAMKKYFAK